MATAVVTLSTDPGINNYSSWYSILTYYTVILDHFTIKNGQFDALPSRMVVVCDDLSVQLWLSDAKKETCYILNVLGNN